MRFSVYEGVKDRRPKSKEATWTQIVAFLTRHKLQEQKDGGLWSPAVYPAGATRKNNSVEAMSCLVLDFDDGQPPHVFEPVWEPFEYVIHSTYSHSPDHPKWRAVFPFAESVPAADWERVYAKLAFSLGLGMVDPSCKDAARMYYLPSCPAAGMPHMFHRRHEGALLDPAKIADLAEVANVEPEREKLATLGRPGDDYDSRENWEALLGPRGWKCCGEWRGQTLWRRPDKKEGWSAKTGEGPAGDRLYSFTSSTALPEHKALSKFGVLAYLDYGGDFGACAKALKKQGYGAADWEAVREANENGKEPEEKPAIIVNNRQLVEITNDALASLAGMNDTEPHLFVRGGRLVRIATDERGVTKLVDIGASELRGELARAARWIRAMKDGVVVEVAPPKDVVEDILALGAWRFPPVSVVTSAPSMAPDGALHCKPGYDPGSRTYCTNSEPWPEFKGSARDARDFLLEEVLGDFPFASDADRAHALGLTLLPFVRQAISGPTPLHLIDAPVQGTGKSLLGKICLMPAVGRYIGATSGSRDEEEWRKKIASSLLEGRAYLFLDNLSRKIDSDALAGVLTSTEWNDRALGSMTNINLPVQCAWIATSNNAELSRDIVRRTVWIRLDAHVERPEDRTEFRHPDIEEWIVTNRPEIVAAVIKILRHWGSLGKPLGKTTIGSYESWARIIGGILGSVGVDGFLANVKELRAQANADETAWGAFYERWWEEHGLTPVKAGDLYPLVQDDDLILGLLGDKSEAGQKTRLGHILRKREGVIARSLRCERIDKHQGTTRFRLERIETQIQTPPTPQVPEGETPPDSLNLNGEVSGVGGVFSILRVREEDDPYEVGGSASETPPTPPQVQNGNQNPTKTPPNQTGDSEEEIW